MIKILKLQRFGFVNPTVVEYQGKTLATNKLDLKSTCDFWRVYFGIYPNETIYLLMSKKDFSAIRNKAFSSVKSAYELFLDQNIIPQEMKESEKLIEWGMYRNNEIESLNEENAALRERLEKAVELPVKVGDTAYLLSQTSRCPAGEIVEAKIIDFIGWEGGYRFTAKGGREWFSFLRGDIGTWVFTTREAAEARLAELKGENE